MKEKQNRYIFAWTFVRLGIGISVLTVLSGVGFAVSQFVRYRGDVSATEYRANENLRLQVDRVANTYAGTSERILHTLDQKTFPAEVSIVDIKDRSKAFLPADSLKKLESLSTVCEASAQSVTAIKRYHITELEDAISALQKILLAHARELREKYQTPAATPGSQAPAKAAAAAPAPASAQPSAASFRIYADSKENDASRDRVINQAKQMMETLRTESSREDSLDAIRRALVYLARADALLDLGRGDEARAAEIENSFTGTKPTVAEATIIARSEQVSAQLGQVSAALQETLYTEWVVDRAVTELQTMVNNERAKAIDADREQHRLFIKAAQEIATTLVIAVAIAFALLVAMDFLRAFLNLSNNSDALRASEVVK